MTNSKRTHRRVRATIFGTVLVGSLAAGGTTLAKGTPVDPAGITTTTVAPVVDPLFPITVGSNGPAVAAVQGKLDITVDCDFGNQTEQAVKDWQTERGDVAVDGIVTQQEWDVLAIPTTWGVDTNLNGKIEPSEVTLGCDGNLPSDPNAPTTTVHVTVPSTQAPQPQRAAAVEQESAFYQNCDAVRAAGAAPIHPGDPGWQQKFDRDHDGVGCE